MSHLLRDDRNSPSVPLAPLGGDLPMRTASFAAPQHGQMLDYMPAHQPPAFNESSLPPQSQPGVNASMHVGMVPGALGGSRRGSMIQDFSAPATNAVFANQWPQVSSPPNPTHGYAYAGQQTHASPQLYGSGTLPMTSAEHATYLSNTFESMPRPGYDPNSMPTQMPGSMFRQPEMHPGAGHPPPAFPYQPQDGTGHRGGHPTMDPDPRHNI